MASKAGPKRERQRPAQPPAPTSLSAGHARPLAVVALVSIFVFVVAVRLQLLSIPFERDEGAYFYLGQLVLDGKTPYVGFYEQKFPGLFYAYAFVILVFGKTVEGAHLGFLVVNVVTVFLVYLVGRKLLDDFSAIVGAASFAVLSLGPMVSGFAAQSEHLVACLAMGGTVLLLRAQEARAWWLFFLSGLVFGAAFLVKPNAVAFIAFGLAALLCRRLADGDGRRLLRDGAWYVAGVATICLVAIVPIIAGGALGEMWYWTYVFNRGYLSQRSLSDGITAFARALSLVVDGYAFFWLAGIAGLVLVWLGAAPPHSKVVVLLLAVSSFLAIVPGFRFFGHYWLQLLPAVALANAAAVHGLRAPLGRRLRPPIAGALLAAVYIGAVASNAWAKRAYYFRPDETRVLRDVYLMNPFPEARVVGRFVKEHTTAQDQILVLGSEPEIYFYADRRAPTRHHYLAFLMGDRTKLPRSTEFQQELVRDVTAAPPRYIVFVRDRISWLMHVNADRSIVGWFDGFAAEHYRLVGLVDLIGPSETQYRWYGDVDGYRPRGQSQINIYERR